MTAQLYYEIIYQNCLLCSYLEYKEVFFCPCTDCPNWMARFGITPDDFIILNVKSFAPVFNKSIFWEGAIYGPEKSLSEIEMIFANIKGDK